MSIDYSETMIQAAEEVAIALKQLSDELRHMRKTQDAMCAHLERLVAIQNNRP